GAVFLIQVFGFFLFLLTLLAIVLSVGLVVDDAIVVVENVERHLSEGKPPFEAAKLGARELVGPVISMTVTLAAVYVPIAFQGGLTGSLFREFALTLAGAVVISGVVALTLSPMMASGMLKTGMDKEGFNGSMHRLFEALKASYRKSLTAALHSRKSMYVTWVVFSLVTIPMFMMSSKELAPMEDQSIIFGILETPANNTLEQTAFFAAQADSIFQSLPEMDFTFQITLANGGFSAMAAKPWDQRERTVFELLPGLTQELGAIPGIQMFPIAPPSLPGGGQFPVEFVIASTAETAEILAFAKQLQGIAAQSGFFAFPPVLDAKFDQPMATLHIDREKVADLGVSMQQVSRDLGVMLGGGYVNRFDLDGRSYKVIPQVERSKRLAPDQLNKIYVSGENGNLVPLSTIATISEKTVPRTLNRMQQLNSVKLSGVAIRPLGETLAYLETEAKKILPQGYTLDYTGESRQLIVEGDKFLPAFSLAMALIFLVLAAQFNSFRDPFIILAGSVPLAMFGALIFTFLKMPAPDVPFWTNGWTTTLNIYSQVGLVTLVGLVAKNGILIVEFANQLQRQGQSQWNAIIEASITRLRPILMTTVATMAGHFPLILVTGAGAAARNSIGLVLVGGMGIGTLFTLFVVPALYLLFSKEYAKSGSFLDANMEYPQRD
ncbi:MAG: efflux RND transporter permease subunit, partial [Pseudomonadales bacterium]|nr:efflux RND transporter permease subunit [Pseudomonadales bacterium]